MISMIASLVLTRLAEVLYVVQLVSCSVLLKKEISENILVHEIDDSKEYPKKREILSSFIKKNSIFFLVKQVIKKLINSISLMQQ